MRQPSVPVKQSTFARIFSALEQRNKPVVLLAVIATVAAIGLWLLLSPRHFSSSGESVATRVYFADRISQAHRLVIDRFNQLHHGKIEVVPVDLPFDKFSTNERKELLARSLRSKSDKLDLFAVDLIWVKRFARWCQPLEEYFGPQNRSRLIPVALQSCLYDSLLVSMPLYIDIGLLYYREDVINRLPDAALVKKELQESMSWPRFLRLRERLGYAGRPFYIFQANDYEGLVCNFLELAVSHDPNFLAHNSIDLTNPAAHAALKVLVDLVRKEHASPPAVTEFDENRSYQYLLDHDAVFVRGWPNFVESFSQTYLDTTKLFTIHKASLPHVDGQPPTSVLGGWNLMLSRYSTRKAEALEFVRFLQTKEAQQILYETDGFLPVTLEIYQDSTYMRAHPDLAYYYTLLNRGFHRPAIVDYTRISDILSHFLRKAIRGDLSAEDALTQATAMINTNKVLIK